MKNFIVSILLLIGSQSHAQVGVITITTEDFIPNAQWYVVKSDDPDWDNHVSFYAEVEVTKSVLQDILDDFDLKFKDGDPDEEGSLYWYLDNGNGYYSNVMFYLEEEGTASLDILTFTEEED
ncbi:MAG: hypothetical protein ACK457_10930 [Flavobacteriia bacterium]|jgi:hypothetical protein